MTTNDIVEKLRNGENVGFLELDDLYAVAESLGADTSLAKRLRGVGFQSKVLIENIENKLKEENLAINL